MLPWLQQICIYGSHCRSRGGLVALELEHKYPRWLRFCLSFFFLLQLFLAITLTITLFFHQVELIFTSPYTYYS